MKTTAHTCLICGRTFFTFTVDGYSVAFQSHVDTCQGDES